MFCFVNLAPQKLPLSQSRAKTTNGHARDDATSLCENKKKTFSIRTRRRGASVV
jgi:hypothetical protein